MQLLLNLLGTNSPTALLLLLFAWYSVQRFQKQEENSEKARTDIKKILYEVKDMTKDLHEWHNVMNPDGSRPWMNAGLERVISELASNIKEQNRIMQQIVEKLNVLQTRSAHER